MRPAVFIDTWAWVALVVTDDPAHQRAEAALAKLRGQGALLVTSNFVLAETLTRLRYDFGLPAALRLERVVALLRTNGWVDAQVVDDAVWAAALDWFRRFDDQRFSFVDCTSFAIMAQRGISEALTGDRHFAAAGFVPLGVA